jgi:uncharacterized protein
MKITTKSSSKNSVLPVIPGMPGAPRWDNIPLTCSYENKKLIIVAGEKTDIFKDPGGEYNPVNAPILLFKCDENFVLSASIEHPFNSKWDGGAIFLKIDSLNWIKFCFEKDYTGAKRVVSVVTKNISDDCNSIEIKSTKVYYKLAKANNVVTLYYSTNGRKYFLVRHLRIKSGKTVEAGFLAQSPFGKSCKVTFSNIKYEARKISNPFTGE